MIDFTQWLITSHKYNVMQGDESSELWLQKGINKRQVSKPRR